MSRLSQLTLFMLGLCIVFIPFSLSDSIAQTDDAAKRVGEMLIDIVQTQAVAWNEGDIDEFMTAYWNSEKLSFSSGGKTHRGWKTTRDRYKKNYPDAATMGKLTFSDLEVEMLGEDAALMLGRWHLKRAKPAQGNFSLIWRCFDDHKWLIVHDHSSSEE
ncbi:MAG: nuclear transport factor 2 family protein [Planctomycetota bacterium]|nr:nuclear transport factor 2 family protein [Planctomycetota bacterium]